MNATRRSPFAICGLLSVIVQIAGYISGYVMFISIETPTLADGWQVALIAVLSNISGFAFFMVSGLRNEKPKRLAVGGLLLATAAVGFLIILDLSASPKVGRISETPMLAKR